MNQSKKIIISILLVIFFMGCGGGGSDAPQQFSQGIWEGTYTTDSGYIFSSFAIITSSGEVGMDLGNGVIFTGECGVSGNNIAMSGGESVGTQAIVQLNGKVSSSNSINLTVTQSGYAMGEGDTFAYSYRDTYDRVSSMAVLSGTWSGTNSFGGSAQTTTLNIDSNGDITGSHGEFTFSGQFLLIDDSVNEYDVDFEIIGATSYSAVGDYLGTATVVDTTVTSDTLVLFIEKQTAYYNRYCLYLTKN